MMPLSNAERQQRWRDKHDPKASLAQDVATITGRNVLVVRRVLDLVVAVHSYGHTLTLTDADEPEFDGQLKLLVVDMAPPTHHAWPLPPELRADIEASFADIIEFYGAILRASATMIARRPGKRGTVDRLSMN